MHRRLGAALLLVAVGGCQLAPAEDIEGGPLHDVDRVAIGQVQGVGATSPRLGQVVAIEGRVVRSLRGDYDVRDRDMVAADRAAGQLDTPYGWFVQDGGDGDPATSDGVLVLLQDEQAQVRLPTTFAHTARLQNRVRSGDRIKLRGVVVEVEQARGAEQLRSRGARVGRGDPDGSLTAILAQRIIVQDPDAPLQPMQTIEAPESAADSEAAEGMRLSPMPAPLQD